MPQVSIGNSWRLHRHRLLANLGVFLERMSHTAYLLAGLDRHLEVVLVLDLAQASVMPSVLGSMLGSVLVLRYSLVEAQEWMHSEKPEVEVYVSE